MATVTELAASVRRAHAGSFLAELSQRRVNDPTVRVVGSLGVEFPVPLASALGLLHVPLARQGATLAGVDVPRLCAPGRAVLAMPGDGDHPLDLLVIGSSCVAARNVGTFLAGGTSDVEVHILNDLDDDRTWGEELARLTTALERAGGIRLDLARLRRALEEDAARTALATRLRAAQRRPGSTLGAGDVQALIRAGERLSVAEHSQLLEQALAAQPRRARLTSDQPIPLALVTGHCQPPPLAVLDSIEAAGIQIVDDDMAPARPTVQTEADPMLGLAAWSHAGRDDDGASSRDDTALRRWLADCGATGVLLATPIACDRQENTLTNLSRRLRALRVPTLAIRYADPPAADLGAILAGFQTTLRSMEVEA